MIHKILPKNSFIAKAKLYENVFKVVKSSKKSSNMFYIFQRSC